MRCVLWREDIHGVCCIHRYVGIHARTHVRTQTHTRARAHARRRRRCSHEIDRGSPCTRPCLEVGHPRSALGWHDAPLLARRRVGELAQRAGLGAWDMGGDVCECMCVVVAGLWWWGRGGRGGTWPECKGITPALRRRITQAALEHAATHARWREGKGGLPRRSGVQSVSQSRRWHGVRKKRVVMMEGGAPGQPPACCLHNANNKACCAGQVSSCRHADPRRAA